MSRLDFTPYRTLASSLNGESTLPSIAEFNLGGRSGMSALGEDEGLFVGYGHCPSPFPYRMQDMYNRTLTECELDSAVLENEYLRAVFLIGYGGRLWSLYDKAAERELLYRNPVVRPSNLAIRNAWLAGGVEWNCGMLGHHPLTCSPLFAAKTGINGVDGIHDGTPVLRMYEFERIRRAVYQMDFFLPDGSKLLYARMRIVNTLPEVIPMYWWSNIAVCESSDQRIVMDATSSYSSAGGLSLVDVPVNDGRDITYPVNSPNSVDYFWKIPDRKRKYVAALGGDGYGLVEASTSRLKGRKLFVWGQGPGGDKWQDYLTLTGSGGRYVEVQAGLAHTQYESLPMPPRTAWEWLEVYGAINGDPAKIHGDWDGARDEVSCRLDELITEERLDEILAATHTMAKSEAQTVSAGSGWCALERYRRLKCGGEAITPHLDFGEMTDVQLQWKHLIDTGFFNKDAPFDSWMFGDDWLAMMKKAVCGGDVYNSRALIKYGMGCFASGKIDDADGAFDAAYRCAADDEARAFALYGKGHVMRVRGDDKGCAVLVSRAAALIYDDISLAKEAMRRLTDAKLYDTAIDLYRGLSANASGIGRIRLCAAAALLGMGRIDEAERIFCEGGVIEVADIREGENSVTDLWYAIEEAKAKRDGREFDRENAEPPAEIDFRMFARKKAK